VTLGGAALSQFGNPRIARTETADCIVGRSCRHESECRRAAHRLVTREAAPPLVVMAPGPAVSALPSQPPSPDGVTAVALAHYRQAFAALQRGDWSTFGA